MYQGSIVSSGQDFSLEHFVYEQRLHGLDRIVPIRRTSCICFDLGQI